MIESIITLLITSVFLFYFGYNAVFKTIETIEKFYNFKINESNNSRVFWMKISGYAILFFTLILIILLVIQIMEMLNGK
jgi:flagellar biosynthesis protein FlhB